MIIGRDILEFLKIALRFLDNVAQKDGSELPFEDGNAPAVESRPVPAPIHRPLAFRGTGAHLSNAEELALKLWC